MMLSVKVITGARMERVEKRDNGYVVKVRAVREGGKANEAVRKALAEHFDVALSTVQIVRGATASLKIITIDMI